MIRLTDRTLSSLDKYDASPEQLRQMLQYLLDLRVSTVELSADVYRKIGTLDPRGRYFLRADFSGRVEEFPGISGFVCRRFLDAEASCMMEVQVNDLSEIGKLGKESCTSWNLRVSGLDDLLLHDYASVFQTLQNRFGTRLELCPQNDYGCAAAIAVEWLLQGGTCVAASFAGVENLAPLEEILLALRLETRYHPNDSYEAFARMRELLDAITGEPLPGSKAVIGKEIFQVESGIHVDGIAKDPRSYEAFPPELVGSARKIVLGSQSGRQAVALRLRELGQDPDQLDLNCCLAAVRRAERELSDADLLDIAARYPARKEREVT